jgi:hypothetical protein
MNSAGLPPRLVPSSLLVVLLRDLKVVLHGDLRGVPQPRADDVDRVLTAVENGGAGRSKMVALGGVDFP